MSDHASMMQVGAGPGGSMGTTTSAQSRVGADTPIWDEEFAARWEALMADQAPAEPAKGKGKARPPRKLRDTPMA